MPMSTSWSSAHQTSRPACQNTEVRFKPFVALIIRVLDLWAPPPPFSFSWELQRLSMSRLVHLSALAAPGLTPEVKGRRITGSTMPQIVDCWCWSGRWEEGYGRVCIRVYVCISLIVRVFIRLCMRAHVSVCAPVFFFRPCIPAVFTCVLTHAKRIVCKKEEPDWPDHRGRWNLMDCRLSKLLLMGIWRPVFEGGKFNFLPLLAGAVWIAWPGIGEGVWHSRLPSHWEVCWESGVGSAACHDSTREECGTAERCQSVCQSVHFHLFDNFSSELQHVCSRDFHFGPECFIQGIDL